MLFNRILYILLEVKIEKIKTITKFRMLMNIQQTHISIVKNNL